MTRLYPRTDLIAATRVVPFGQRFMRPRTGQVAIRLAFIEAYHRCPDCAADDRARFADSYRPFDAARDRGLLRRDVNEALEIIVTETLGDRCNVEVKS